jgi:glucosylglycerate synthase
LPQESFLSDDFLRQLINVGEVDILVGLPTHNNAKTIDAVLHTIQAGLLTDFRRERTVIVNFDGGSRDGTPELILKNSIDDIHPALKLNALRTLPTISTRYSNTPSNRVAFRSMLAAAELLRAKACVVMSPESANVEPTWVSKLLRPVLREGFDLVTPTYRRNKFQGLLITNLLYPMTRALYGAKIREALAPEFAFSGAMGGDFLAQNAWDNATDSDGTDLIFTLAAVKGKRRICQTFLGEREQSDARPADLVPALRQTAGTLFTALETDFPVWSSASDALPVPSTGPDHEVSIAPMRVNRKRLRDIFTSGMAELGSVYQSILDPATLSGLQAIAQADVDDFHYSAELWVKTIYEFAAAYKKSVINRDHIIQALAPLFRGRALTFVSENRDASADGVETSIESLCVEFERQKPYLLQIWNSTE